MPPARKFASVESLPYESESAKASIDGQGPS